MDFRAHLIHCTHRSFTPLSDRGHNLLHDESRNFEGEIWPTVISVPRQCIVNSLDPQFKGTLLSRSTSCQ
jgi:hypothetical protein